MCGPKKRNWMKKNLNMLVSFYKMVLAQQNDQVSLPLEA
jgi:hypothetical protein